MPLTKVPGVSQGELSRWIVLDTGALIAGTDSLYALGGLNDVATKQSAPTLYGDGGVTFFVTPDVIAETRDARARERLLLLEQLGCVVARAPSAEAVAEVAVCAKRTGDYSVLSYTDLQVLALTFMLEIGRNGRRFLKEVPEERVVGDVRSGRGVAFEEIEKREIEERERKEREKEDDDGWTTVVRQPKQEEAKGLKTKKTKRGRKKKKTAGNLSEESWDLAHVNEAENNLKEDERAEELPGSFSQMFGVSEDFPAEDKAFNGQGLQADKQVTDHVLSVGLLDNSTPLQATSLDNRSQSSINEEAALSEMCSDTQLSALNVCTYDEPVDVKEEDLSGEDDGIDWINEENVEAHLARDGGVESMTEEDRQRVACVTTDFAMQNVMLQMGLKLLSVDGRRMIRQIRRFALRCHSCSAVTRELQRKFCERCGNATMHRVTFKVDKKGVARAFLNPKKKAILRGSKYSIPLPRGGRHNKDLILCEDQIDPIKQKRLEKQRQKLNVDVLDPTSFYNAGARFNPHHRSLVVGYGKRNPNEVRPSSKSKR